MYLDFVVRGSDSYAEVRMVQTYKDHVIVAFAVLDNGKYTPFASVSWWDKDGKRGLYLIDYSEKRFSNEEDAANAALVEAQAWVTSRSSTPRRRNKRKKLWLVAMCKTSDGGAIRCSAYLKDGGVELEGMIGVTLLKHRCHVALGNSEDVIREIENIYHVKVESIKRVVL
jgi:hypothetical protein